MTGASGNSVTVDTCHLMVAVLAHPGRIGPMQARWIAVAAAARALTACGPLDERAG